MGPVIFGDFLSALKAVCSSHPLKRALVVATQEKVLNASHGGKEVVFCWVPSHVGIPGSEAAHRVARPEQKGTLT